MKTTTNLFLFGLAICLSSFASTASAAIVAEDHFYYADGDLNGQSGGIGAWSTPWSAPSSAESLLGGVVNITGNNANAAVRSFTSQSGNDLYFSFTLKFTGNLNNNDFLSFWIDDGTSTLLHDTFVPNMGIKANLGPSGTDYYVRLNNGAEQYSATQAVLGNTVQLVGHLEKISGQYRKISLWVNTTPGVLLSLVPQATHTFASGYSAVSRLGFRTENLDSSPQDTVSIDFLQIHTTLDGAVTIPEPATMAIWGSMGLFGLVAGYRRRNKKS